MNKRASIIVGNTLITLPVFILLLTIMAFFLFLSATNTIFSKPESLGASYFVGSQKSVFNEIQEVQFEGVSRSMTLLELAVRSEQRGSSINSLSSFARTLVLNEIQCVGYDINLADISQEQNTNLLLEGLFLKVSEGRVVSNKKSFSADVDVPKKYFGNAIYLDISLNDVGSYRDAFIEMYSGSCQDE